jgi:hypothetical protein
MKLIGIILVLSVPFAASIVIECKYTIWTNKQCNLIKDPNITERDTVVTIATGNDENSMNHANVTVFFSRNDYTINYMPRGLNDLFPNLVTIWIQNCHLKEIRQTDLQPFRKLRKLYLNKNDIETIERDLFKYNPKMQRIGLSDNKITRVDPNVFDHLNELRRLGMYGNKCADGYANNRTQILKFISKVTEQCTIKNWMKKIKQEVTKISDQVESQNENIKSLEDEFASKNGNTMTKKLHYAMKCSIVLMFITSILASQ